MLAKHFMWVFSILLLSNCKAGTDASGSSDMEQIGSTGWGGAQAFNAAKGKGPSECPTKAKPADGWPLVFTVNGNALGPVKADGKAADLAAALRQRGVCAIAIAHPSLNSASVFESNIIATMNQHVQRLAGAGLVNKDRIGVAGYSGGGAVAAIVASRFAKSDSFTVKGVVSYYGPLDMNAYFDFHGARGKGQTSQDPIFAGEKGPQDICNTAHGPQVCQTFSASALKLVSSYVGMSLGNRDFLSVRKSTSAPAPIYGCYGNSDDNITVRSNQRILESVWGRFNVEHKFQTYAGGHGVSWNVCPDSLGWLIGKLSN